MFKNTRVRGQQQRNDTDYWYLQETAILEDFASKISTGETRLLNFTNTGYIKYLHAKIRQQVSGHWYL